VDFVDWVDFVDGVDWVDSGGGTPARHSGLLRHSAPSPVLPAPPLSFRRRACPWLEQGPESRITSARFALLRKAEGARKRGIPAFAGMTEKSE